VTMGSTRESLDLFHKYGFRNFWHAIRRRRFTWVRRYVFRDTFTHWICRLSGGHEFYWAPDPAYEPDDKACCWCHNLLLVPQAQTNGEPPCLNAPSPR